MMFSRKALFGILGSTALAFSLSSATWAGTITVAKTGGTTASTNAQAVSPGYFVRTIGDAITLSADYDSIEVTPDTYNESLRIKNKNHLIIQPKVVNGGWSGRPIIIGASGENDVIVKIEGSQNIYFGGFEVTGRSGSSIITGRDCSGIAVLPSNDAGGNITRSLQVDIEYCSVHDVGGLGIGSVLDQSTQTVGCDYIRITSNTVYATNSTGIYNSSAISLLVDQKSDSAGGYHDVIQNNVIHDNINKTTDDALHTDCNGIIVDSSGINGTPTIIQNNVVYKNYGRGIYVFDSSNVDVYNNTCYLNCQDPVLFKTPKGKTLIGEIVVLSYMSSPTAPIKSQNVNVYNNLCYSRANVGSSRFNVPCYTASNYGYNFNYPNTSTPDPNNWLKVNVDPSVQFNTNSYWGGAGTNFVKDPSSSTTVVTGTNIFAVNPMFVNAATGHFQLNTGSGAIDAGTFSRYASYTIDGLQRPVGGGIDLGAYDRKINP